MIKNDFLIIETDRLTLMKLEESDWQVISYLRSDKEVNSFVKRPSAKTKEEALDFITKINQEIEHKNVYYWKITEKNQNNMIGSICLWNFSPNKKSAEIGYDLSPLYQKRGIMNEALTSVINFGFKKLNLALIKAYTHHQNVNSIKLLDRNGFNLVTGEKDDHNADNIIYELKSP